MKQVKDNECKIKAIEIEKDEQNKKIIKTLGENTKILQKCEKLQEKLIDKNKEISEFHQKLDQLFKEKTKNNELQVENISLSKKIMHLQIDLLSKEENYNQSLYILHKEIQNLSKSSTEKDTKIDQLTYDIENLNKSKNLLE